MNISELLESRAGEASRSADEEFLDDPVRHHASAFKIQAMRSGDVSVKEVSLRSEFDDGSQADDGSIS